MSNLRSVIPIVNTQNPKDFRISPRSESICCHNSKLYLMLGDNEGEKVFWKLLVYSSVAIGLIAVLGKIAMRFVG